MEKADQFQERRHFTRQEKFAALNCSIFDCSKKIEVWEDIAAQVQDAGDGGIGLNICRWWKCSNCPYRINQTTKGEKNNCEINGCAFGTMEWPLEIKGVLKLNLKNKNKEKFLKPLGKIMWLKCGKECYNMGVSFLEKKNFKPARFVFLKQS
ncbi:MAG: hypothetical protein ABII74_04410 [Elusimicrobiota bacterium]